MRSFVKCVLVLLVVCFVSQIALAGTDLVPVVFPAKSPSAVPTPDKDYVLPYRNDQAAKEAATASGIQALLDATNRNGAMLGELLNLEKGKAQAPKVEAPKVEPVAPPTLQEKVEAKKEEIKDAVLESPFLRHAAALAGVIIVLLVLHAIYVKCHADKDKIKAGLNALPIGGPVLAQLFDKLDGVNTAIDTKVQAVKSGLESKLEGVQKQVTDVALATPAPVAAPVVAK